MPHIFIKMYLAKLRHIITIGSIINIKFIYLSVFRITIQQSGPYSSICHVFIRDGNIVYYVGRLYCFMYLIMSSQLLSFHLDLLLDEWFNILNVFQVLYLAVAIYTPALIIEQGESARE